MSLRGGHTSTGSVRRLLFPTKQPPVIRRLLTALPKEHTALAYGASVGTMWRTAQVSGEEQKRPRNDMLKTARNILSIPSSSFLNMRAIIRLVR